MKKNEKVTVTFRHEDKGDELVCSIVIPEKGDMKMEVKRKGDEDVMKADSTLQALFCAFVAGLRGSFNAENGK